MKKVSVGKNTEGLINEVRIEETYGEAPLESYLSSFYFELSPLCNLTTDGGLGYCRIDLEYEHKTMSLEELEAGLILELGLKAGFKTKTEIYENIKPISYEKYIDCVGETEIKIAQ